jgi:hypothetical protein
LLAVVGFKLKYAMFNSSVEGKYQSVYPPIERFTQNWAAGCREIPAVIIESVLALPSKVLVVPDVVPVDVFHP